MCDEPFCSKKTISSGKIKNQCAFVNSEVVKKTRKLRNMASKRILLALTHIRTDFSPVLVMSHTTFSLCLGPWGEVGIRMKFCHVQRDGIRPVKSHFSSSLFKSGWKCCTEPLRAP